MTSPVEVLARYTARLRRAGHTRTSIVADLLYAAAGLALVDGADASTFVMAAAMAWRRFNESLRERKARS